MSRLSYWVVVQTDAGWHVQLKAGNHRIILSSEVYTTFATAEHAAYLACAASGSPVRTRDRRAGSKP